MSEKEVTSDDLSDLRYFWEEKGDITRWTGYDPIRPALEREYPEIVKAWDDYITARRTLTAVLRGAESAD